MQPSNIFVETQRLILRPPQHRDFDGWARLMGEQETARFIGGVQPRPVAWRTFLTMAGAWLIQGFGMFSVIEKASGRWLGRIGPWYPEDWPGNEVGWALLREAWGRGYATEAATASIDYAFDKLGWHEVVHVIHPDNAPSLKVAERLGSRLLRPCRMPAPFDGEPAQLWGQTRDEWRARRKSGVSDSRP